MNPKEENLLSSRSLNLQQSPIQNFKNLQQLMLSQKMQQAISILQLPVMELSHLISEELEQNPLLECEEDDLHFIEELEEFSEPTPIKKLDEEFCNPFEDRDLFAFQSPEKDKTEFILENFSYNPSLFEFLMKQAFECIDDQCQREIAEWVIGNLDDFGFLSASLEELASMKGFSIDQLKSVLKIIQTFDPLGIGARNLQESLLIQLNGRGKHESLAYQIVEKHFDALIHNNFLSLSRDLNTSPVTIREVIDKEIACLDLHPGLSYESVGDGTVPIVTPDLYIRKEMSHIEIEINQESLPVLKINAGYRNLLDDGALSLEARHYIQSKITSGKWLLKSIEQRHSTLYRIAREIVEMQEEYLFLSDGKLRPLTMKTIAEKLLLNESTVARAIANKYVDCPKGIVSLRTFFTHGFSTDSGDSISSTCVKDLIREIIHKENPSKPLSDEAISLLIKEKGIPCARRTIAKYRQELKLGSASQRKRFGYPD